MSELPGDSLTAVSAADLLAAAENGSGEGNNLARSAAVNDGAFAIAIGILVASFLLCVEYIFPTRIPALLAASIAVYGVGVVGMVLWHRRARRASRSGWTKRYTAACAITMALYAVGVALSVGDTTHSLAFWLPYAALTAVPLVIAALRGSHK